MRVASPSLKSTDSNPRLRVQRLKSASDLEKVLSQEAEFQALRQSLRSSQEKFGSFSGFKEFYGLAKASLAETYTRINPSLERNIMRVSIGNKGKNAELPDVSVRSYKAPQPLQSNLKPEEVLHINRFYQHPADSKGLNKLPLPNSPHFNPALFSRKNLQKTQSYPISTHLAETMEGNKRFIFSVMPKEEGPVKDIDTESVNHPTTALTFYWSEKQLGGSRPEGREGASMVLLDRKVYLFGGQSMVKRNDLRVMQPDTGVWSMLPTYYTPKGRIGHSLCPYKNMLILYGGWSHYSQRLRMRRCFKKVHVLTLGEENRWQRYSCSGDTPKSRRDHAMASLGSSMIVFGGIDGHSQILRNARVLDMEILRWYKLALKPEHNKPGKRSFATLTPVFPLTWTLRWDISISNLPRPGPDSSYGYIGFYLFGGLGETAPLNDLWVLKVTDGVFSWQEMRPTGVAPSPRFAHTTTHIGQMLVVYGGRNDRRAGDTINGAFNDVVILRLDMMRWEHVSCSGTCPEGRWGHCAAGLGSKVLIFGGLNYAAFVPASVYILETEQSQVTEMVKIEEAREEKIRQRQKFIHLEL